MLSELQDLLAPYSGAILRGVAMTIQITFLSVVAGALIGIFVAPMISRNGLSPPVRLFLTVLVEIIRAVPPLVWLIWAYFAAPRLFGIELSSASTAVLVFSMIYAAFAADIFRGAIDNIPIRLLESGRSIGMSDAVLLRRIVIPEVVRRSIPPLNGQTVGMLKMSSLASVIAVPELTYSFQMIVAQRPLPVEIYSIMAVMYCVTIFPIVLSLRILEKTKFFTMSPTSNADR